MNAIYVNKPSCMSLTFVLLAFALALIFARVSADSFL